MSDEHMRKNWILRLWDVPGDASSREIKRLCGMALRTLDAEARNRELEGANEKMARGLRASEALRAESPGVNYEERQRWQRWFDEALAFALAATPPPDSEPAESSGGNEHWQEDAMSVLPIDRRELYDTPPERRDALEADIKQAASLVERGHTDLAVHVLREGMRALSNPAGEVVVTTNEQGDCLGCQGGSVHHTCGCEPDANPTQQHRDALEACDELDAWLDQLIDFASAAPPSKKRCIERIRRALSTGVPEAFRRTIAFAQEECQEPSVMHVSDMARLIRDYAQAELDRALPQPQEGESDE